MRAQTSWKILVIGNESNGRTDLHDLLEAEGYRVGSAPADRSAGAGDPEPGETLLAILLDGRSLNGSDDVSLARVRSISPDAAVIIVTGPPAPEWAKSAALAGAELLPGTVEHDVLRATLTHLKRLREAEQRAGQAEHLASVGQLAAVLAHEGRNALQLMANHHALVSVLAADRSAILEAVGGAEQARQNLTRLFEDLLLYARTPTLRREPLDVRSLWRNAWAELLLRPGRKAAELVEDDGGAKFECDGDPFRLGQVFRNLFENALAACPEPVRVEVRCSEVTHRGRPALRLAVRDNGPGLTPEQREKIFEPFYSTKASGTGLGLAISKRILEAHGGDITLGEGSGGAEFLIVLPLSPGNPPEVGAGAGGETVNCRRSPETATP